jgi:hypothetical protein
MLRREWLKIHGDKDRRRYEAEGLLGGLEELFGFGEAGLVGA